MKQFLFFLLLALFAEHVRAQGELFVEKYEGTQVFYKSKGCSPNDGVIVYYSSNPNLKFTMPDTPKRLKSVAPFDPERNCYVLCVQPTSSEIGGITKYSIDIIDEGRIPVIHEIRDVKAAATQYFTIKSDDDVRQYALKKSQSDLILKTAEDAFEKGEYAEAVKLYRAAADYSPDRTEMIKWEVAIKYKKKADELLAIIGKDQIVKRLSDFADDIYPPQKNDNNSIVFKTLETADKTFEQGNYDDAIRLYQEAANKNPDKKESILRGAALKFKAKAADLQKVIGDDPTVIVFLDYAKVLEPVEKK